MDLVTYFSIQENRSFKDNGYSLGVRPELTYGLNNFFSIVLTTSLIRDFLRINAPKSQEDFFKGNTFLSLGVGIRVTLFKAKK